jgi:hypothetical protein
MNERKKRMNKQQSRDRDRLWYDQWKSGKTQTEIADENGTYAPYVSLRISKHRDRVETGVKSKSSYDVQAAALLLINADKEELEKQLQDFISLANHISDGNIADLHLELNMITSQFPRCVLGAVDKTILRNVYRSIVELSSGGCVRD